MLQFARHSVIMFNALFSRTYRENTYVHIASRALKAGNYAFYDFIDTAHAFKLFSKPFFPGMLGIISRLAWEGSRCIGTIQRLGVRLRGLVG